MVLLSPLKILILQLEAQGYKITVMGPQHFLTIPVPTYPELSLAINGWKVKKLIPQINPDIIHISTEGTIGSATRKYCVKHKIPFTSAFHTKLPDYISMRLKFISKKWLYKINKRFHSAAEKTLVPTKSIKQELENYGYKNLIVWEGAIDQKLFWICETAKFTL